HVCSVRGPQISVFLCRSRAAAMATGSCTWRESAIFQRWNGAGCGRLAGPALRTRVARQPHGSCDSRKTVAWPLLLGWFLLGWLLCLRDRAATAATRTSNRTLGVIRD